MRKFLMALCALSMTPLNAMADSQASADKLRCSGGQSPYYGRTDGVCVETSDKGLVAVGNGDKTMALNRFLLVDVFEDFLGGGLNVTDSMWRIADTSAAGSPTQAIRGDADNGELEFTLAATNEAENLTLYWGDEQNIDSDLGPILTFRVVVNTLPAAANEIMVFGLATAQNDDEDATTNHAWFKLDADGDLLIESDDATTNDDDNDTAVDLVADTAYEFKVDCSTPTDCDFFYRSTMGGDWTELLEDTAFSIGADVALQPYFQVQKASGTNQPSLYIDYIHLLWERN